jgi:hypothetical protein
MEAPWKRRARQPAAATVRTTSHSQVLWRSRRRPQQSTAQRVALTSRRPPVRARDRPSAESTAAEVARLCRAETDRVVTGLR